MTAPPMASWGWSQCSPITVFRDGRVVLGLGRIVALYYRSSTL
jgi:hypothetical protein